MLKALALAHAFFCNNQRRGTVAPPMMLRIRLGVLKPHSSAVRSSFNVFCSAWQPKNVWHVTNQKM